MDLENTPDSGFDIRKAVAKCSSLEDILKLLDALFGESRGKTNPAGYHDAGSDYGLKVSGKKKREALNAQCREILERVNSPEDLTDEDREILLQYSGRGGTDEGSQDEYYTPTYVAQGVWGAMFANGFLGGITLEPSAGAGVFLGTKPNSATMHGNDIDPTSSKVAALLNPQSTVSNLSFEELSVNTEDDSYDACITNIPFGNARGASKWKDPAYKDESRIDRYFIYRILDKLRPGGLACLICPTCIVGDKGKEWTSFRTKISKRAEFLGAHKLPSGTFRAQGTDTVVDVLVFRKHDRSLLDAIAENAFTPEVLEEANVLWTPFIEGKYWQGEGRKYIMGTYIPKEMQTGFRVVEKVEGKIDQAAMKEKLAQKFHSRIDYGLLAQKEPEPVTYSEGDTRYVSGSRYVFRDGVWQRQETEAAQTAINATEYGVSSKEELVSRLSEAETALSLSFAQADKARLLGVKIQPEVMAAIRFAGSQKKELQEQCYRGALLGAMLEKISADQRSGEDVDKRRSTLQNIIVQEIEKYGHPQNRADLKKAGSDARHYGLFMRSVDTNGNFSDLLKGQIDNEAATGYRDDNIADIVRYLYTTETNHVSIEDVQRLYKGDGKVTSLEDIALNDDIAITPEGFIMPKVSYLQGETTRIIADLENAIGLENSAILRQKYQAQINEIKAKIPVTPIENINFDLQQRWFKKQYIVDFLRENGYPDAGYCPYKDEKRKSITGEEYILRSYGDPDSDAPVGEFLLHEPPMVSSGYEKQLEKWINGKRVTSSKSDNIYEYENAVEDLNSLFNTWMHQRPDTDSLVDNYRFTFNTFIPLEHNTAKLDIDEYISGEVTPHTYQNAEVHRLSNLGCGICGFGTGLGKTKTALSLVAYNVKHGVSKKVCIVVPNAVLENWYHEAKEFYNEDFFYTKIKFVGLKRNIDKNGNLERIPIKNSDGTPKLSKKTGEQLFQDVVKYTNGKEVTKDMWDIPNNNYSLIVMSKEKFETVPLKEESVKRYTQFMVDANLSDGGEKKKGYKGNVQKKRLEGEFSDTGRDKKQQLPYLEDMGIDSIITDETHYYKNSMKGGPSVSSIEGLPNPVPSDVARDMAMKCHYIRSINSGRGVYGLTATPVTNSPVEIYNVLSLVAPHEDFEQRCLGTIDEFIRTFGRVDRRQMFLINGEAAQKTVLSGFQNLSALRSFWNKYVNIKTMKDVGTEIHVPTQVDVESEIEMTDEQEKAYEYLRARIKYFGKPENYPGYPPIPENDAVFSIMRDMDKCTTDIDMYNGVMTFFLDASKYEKIIDDISSSFPKHYKTYEIDEETKKRITIEGDFVPKVTKAGSNIQIVIHEQQEKEFLKALKNADIDESVIRHPISPKYAKLIENARHHLETKGKQIVFTEEKTQHQKIARILAQGLNIDLATIAIINGEDASGEKLDKIVKAYNVGMVTIVVANRKAEVGVNLQKGTTAIHHLTLPWTPASINQRNGRGVRQGNNVESVDVYYYYGKGTFDQYRKQTLETKADWINELLTGETDIVENGDVEADQLLTARQAGRLEEYLAAKEQEKTRRKELQNKFYVGKLAQIYNMQATLDKMEHDRTEGINEYESELKRYSYDLKMIAGSSKFEKHRKDIEKKVEKLKMIIEKIKGQEFASTMEALKLKIESAKNSLKEAAKDGKLPYDIAILDHPEDYYVSLRGEILPTHGYVEAVEDIEKKGSRNFYTLIAEKGEILLINNFNRKTKELSLIRLKRSIPGQNELLIPIDSPQIKAITISDADKVILESYEKRLSYIDLFKKKLSEEAFVAIRDRVRLDRNSYCICHGNEVYSYKITDVFSSEDWVYPNPSNEDFKNAVFQHYKHLMSRELQDPYAIKKIKEFMESLFGKNFYEELGQVSATDSEINAFISSQGQKIIDSKIKGDDDITPPNITSVRLSLEKNMNFDEFFNKYSNGERLRELHQDYVLRQIAILKKKRQEIVAAREARQAVAVTQTSAATESGSVAAENTGSVSEAEKSEESRGGIPKKWVDAFAQMGVTIVFNETQTHLEWRGRFKFDYAPHEGIFMQDKAGKQGVLKRHNTSIKEQYKGSFTMNWREREGAWWHVRADIVNGDFAKLYNDVVA